MFKNIFSDLKFSYFVKMCHTGIYRVLHIERGVSVNTNYRKVPTFGYI